MIYRNDKRDAVPALLVAIATAMAAYMPAAMAWDAGMRWLRPIAHAEEMMARGLEAMFIGGPVGALALAAFAGRISYCAGERVTVAIALVALVVAVLIAFATAKFANIL